MPNLPLPPDALRHRCELSALPFQTTAELEPLDGPFEQARAAEALAFGASMRSEGYHVYALGPPGVGKHRLVAQVLAEQAPRAPVPSDWCYVHDFSAPQRPRRLELPAGAGVRLQRDMEALVEELRAAVPAAFESEEYRNRLQALHKEMEQQREAALAALSEKARARGVALVRTPVGFAVAPLKEGQVVDPEEFHKLPAAEQDRIRVDLEAVQEALGEVVRDFPAQDRKHREQVKTMNREVALGVAGHLVDEVRNRWAELPQVATYLQEVGRDVVENVHEFLASPESGEDGLAPQIRKLLAEGPALRRYAINVLVDRTGLSGAPVVYEDLPSHAGLVGRIEHRAHFGALWTDFTLVRAGALHRANGGYLVVDVRRLLAQPFAWEDLKRALRSGQIRIDPPERLLGLSGVAALEPEPIPLVVKVVLVGDRLLHLLLSELDPEFSGLFKVTADFEEQAPRAEGGELRLARLVTGIVRDEQLRPLDREAVARDRRAGVAPGRGRREADHPGARHRRPGPRVGPRGRPGAATGRGRSRRAGRARRGRASPGPDPAAHPSKPSPRARCSWTRRVRSGPGERPLRRRARTVHLRPAEPHHRARPPGTRERSWTSSGRSSWGDPSTRRGSSSWRASSAPASLPTVRCPCGPASSSSSRTAGSRGTAPPRPSSTPCSRRSPGSPSARGSR